MCNENPAKYLYEKNTGVNDSKQSQALLRLAQETGTKDIVLVYRDDVYGNDLKTNIMHFAQQINMDINQEVKYSPDETNFESTISVLNKR